MCSSVGRAAISKVAGRGFESLRTRAGFCDAPWALQKGALVRGYSTVFKKAYGRFEDLKSEFCKIQWIEDRHVLTCAKMVVLATFVCGMVLYIADLVVQRALTGVDSVLRLIFG